METSKPQPQFTQQPDASIESPANTPGHSMPFADQVGNYQRYKTPAKGKFNSSRVFIVGGGIAGLAAAFYCIRDGQVKPEHITIIEQLETAGGSLDGAGNADEGFIVRGGREMDFTYENFWDMFQDIPAVELPEPFSVLDEYHAANDEDPNYSKCRLLHKQGQAQDFGTFGLNSSDQLAVIKLLLKRKDELDDLTIEDYFSEEFLNSNFWMFWRTMFAFENWHSLLELKLYMHRFLHAIDGLNDMSSLVFPKYNQYEAFVKPLQKFLQAKGVKVEFGLNVTDLVTDVTPNGRRVTSLIANTGGAPREIKLEENDFIFITTGSMTEDTRYGGSNTVAKSHIPAEMEGESAGWQLWNNLAKKGAEFGRPAKFNKHVTKSAWMSATLTCRPSAFTEKIKELAINDPYSGKTVTGGIISVTDSNWLISFTVNRQPHFMAQPKDVLVVWVYGLFMNTEGNYISKYMPDCTGHEILEELCYHLGLLEHKDEVLKQTIVRTAYMPYITSMFMPRAKGDRPEIVPKGYCNLGLLGQFVETANDVVFTMESSVRTARVAVYTLLGLHKQVPDIVPMQYDIRHLLKAARALNDGKETFIDGILSRILRNTYFDHILPVTTATEEAHKDEGFLTRQWEKFKHLF